MGKFIDLTNKKIGDWIIVCREKNDKNTHTKWRLRCKCGKEITLTGPYLKKGWNQKDCGCSRSLIGKKIGKLTILEREKRDGKPVSNWLCQCECGNKKIFRGDYIRGGRVKSCGCAITKSADEIGPGTVYNHYKQASKKRKFEFSLTKEELKKIIETECFYCGTLNSNTFRIKKTKNYMSRFYSYNGIDRIDNGKGYTNENCVPCCNICNLMKRELSIDEWFSQMRKILEFST